MCILHRPLGRSYLNVKKNKAYAFEKKRVKRNIKFYINNELVLSIDNLRHFKGVNFKYNCNLSSALKVLHDQALSATIIVYFLFDETPLDFKTKLSLFDSMVVPNLLYGSEVLGLYNFKDVDKLHIRFLKSLLGVNKQTPNIVVYGESGRFLLSVI